MTVLTSFADELEKIGGFREAGRFLATGRSTVYHGTSRANAKNIRGAGLRAAKKKGGVSDAVPGLEGEKDLVFTARSKKHARNYAKQQQHLEYADRAIGAVPENIKKRIADSKAGRLFSEAIEEQGGKPDQAARRMAGVVSMKAQNAVLGRLPKRARKPVDNLISGDVTEAHVPWKKLRRNLGTATEPQVGPMAQKIEDLPVSGKVKKVGKTLLNVQFMHDVPVKKKVTGRYIKGSDKYRKVSVEEVKQHARAAKAQPKEFGYEFLRNLTGIERRPDLMATPAARQAGVAKHRRVLRRSS
jgi:hypothetical protein